jgi:hypothetical protein
MSDPKRGYFENLQEIKASVVDLRTKSEAILNTKSELFQTIIIQPDNALTADKLKHIQAHSKKLCENENISARIKECTESNPEDNAVFLETAINQIKRGVYNADEIRGKVGKTQSQLQKELIKEFSAKLELVKYGTQYPDINSLNKKVQDFRSAGLSLYEEFAEQQQEYAANLKTYNENKAPPIKKSFNAEFMGNEAGAAIPKWDSKATSGNAVAVVKLPEYEYGTALTIAPQLKATPHHDSPDALKNLLTKGYYFLDSQMGAMQVAFIKNVLLPAAIKVMCTVHTHMKTSDASLQVKYDISNAFERYEFLALNFETIFKGFDTDYYDNIIAAVNNIKDVRINDADGSINLDYFTKGLHEIIEMTRHVETQHGLPQSKVVTNLLAECPEFASQFLGQNAQPLLMITSEEIKASGESFHSNSEL